MNKKITYTVVFLAMVGSLYIFSGMYAKKVASEAIAEAEPAIKFAFRNLVGSQSQDEETVFSYDIAGANIWGNVDLENVILRNKYERKPGEVSISIAKVTVSSSGNYLTLIDGENFKAEDDRGGFIVLDRFGVVDFLVSDVSRAKDIREAFDILSFSNLELRNLKFKEKENQPEQGFSSLSVAQLNEGRLTDLSLEGLDLHWGNGEKLKIERISFDKLDELLEPIFGEDKALMASIKNGFSLGSFKLDNVQLKTGETEGSLAIGGLSIDLERDEMLLNSIFLRIDDVGIEKSTLSAQGFPDEILNELNRDQLMMSAALDISADFLESSLNAEISLGIEKLGELSANLSLGGFSKALFTTDNPEVLPDEELLMSEVSFASAGLTYGDDGLSEALFSFAEKNGLARQQIALMVTNFSTAVVEPSQQAITESAIKSFSESGEMFNISLVAKSSSGVSLKAIAESFPSSISEKLRIEVDAR